MRSGSSIPRGTHAARARTGRIADCHPADSPLSPPGTPDLPDDMRTRGGRQARTGVPGRTAGGLTVRKAHVGQVDSYGRDGQGAWRPVAPRATGRSRRQEQRGRPSGTGLGDRRLQPQMAQDPTDHRRILHDRDQREAPPPRSDRRARRYRSCAASAPSNDCPPAGNSRHRRRLVPRRQPQPRRLPDRDGRRFPGRDEPQDRTGPRGHATRRAAPTPRDTGPSGRGVSAAGRAADRAVRTVRAGGRRAAGRRCQRAAPAALPTTPSTRQVALAMPLAEAPWAVDEEEPHSTSKHISSGAPAVDAGDAATEPLRARQDAGEHPRTSDPSESQRATRQRRAGTVGRRRGR